MKTHSLNRRRTRTRSRYATRMLSGQRAPRPNLDAICRALSALIRLKIKLLGARNPAQLLNNTWFPRSYAHLLRAYFHLNVDLMPLARRKSKSGKETVNKR